MKLGTLFLAFCAMLFIPFTMFAQSVDTTGIANFNFENMTAAGAENLRYLIYGAVVILVNIAAKAFGWKIGNSFVYVVIANGLAIGVLFLVMKWGDALPLAISLIASMGLFDIGRPVVQAVKTATAKIPSA